MSLLHSIQAFGTCQGALPGMPKASLCQRQLQALLVHFVTLLMQEHTVHLPTEPLQRGSLGLDCLVLCLTLQPVRVVHFGTSIVHTAKLTLR